MKKIFISMIVITIIVLFSVDALAQEKYNLFRTRDIDTATGARRTVYDIEVGSDTKDEEIKVILEYAVKELAKKREVDAMSVRLYLKDTNLPYAIADWAPNGDWSKAERGKSKSVFKTSITMYPEHRPKESSKVEKYGLSMKQRKMIYHEVSQSQKNTKQIAEKKYPSDIMKQYDYMEELDKKYENEICKKYGISDEQKCKIVDEGVNNNWSE